MRLLVATVPLDGHVTPMRELVRAVVANGHDVTWVADEAHGETIAATGARFFASGVRVPIVRGGVKAQLREMFIAPAPAQAAELARHRADAILADAAHLGAALHAEAQRVPWIGLGISALMVPSVDTAPFGSALRPAWVPTTLLRRALGWLVRSVAFADINRAWRRARVAAGLPAGAQSYFDVIAPDLFLQPTVPSFEYPRRDLPAQVRFIGPLLPPPRGELPA